MKEKELHWKTEHGSHFDRETDFLRTLLIDSGVPEDEVKTFMRPTVKCINDPYKMKNMEKAVDLLHKHVWESEGKNKILVRVDCD